MANPYLPSWEYIPDGEPRVFGNRVYVYGSHDCVDSDEFCDYRLKVWSASVDDLNHWVCHGDIFRTRAYGEHPSDVDWTQRELYAPDVVEKDGKYYLYAYIVDDMGCVAVSDRPEGPFTLLSKYVYQIPEHTDKGTLIDPGVLVDDDGRVYLYGGFNKSFLMELNAQNMYEVIDGSYQENFLPAQAEGEKGFFEACSPRKIGNTYYMIYSPTIGSRLDYATSDSPTGPFTYRGTIIDNSIDYPGGNDHGSICCIKGQWYIFYHRMTNGTIMSRQGCVERITILPDGTIPQVEMTSLGFEEALNPYQITRADSACVLKGGCFLTEINCFERVLTQITDGCVMGWKYFEFGEDNDNTDLMFTVQLISRGCSGTIEVFADAVSEENKIGEVTFSHQDHIASGKVASLSGRHAIFLRVLKRYMTWAQRNWDNRPLVDIKAFVFQK